MYTLKSIAQRGTLFGATAALVLAAVLPSTAVFADALNPLTERSLTLSSSSPGWSNTDGSGNTTYAPPNSGANGQKTGNYFGFKVSSDSTTTNIKAMSFQYCTKSAGQCSAPGDDSGAPGSRTDDAGHSDLNVVYPSATEIAPADFGTVIDAATGNVKAVPGYTNSNPKYSGTGDPAEAAKSVAGNFIVMSKNAGTWTQSTGWTATTSNQEESPVTGAQNTIILQNAGVGFTAGTPVKVLFFATTANYITNPGSGAFFVKINTFKNFTALAAGTNTLAQNIASGDVIDGGVTVANVMNQSIQITTKVLETMEFSVGTVDPDTLTKAELGTSENVTGSSHIPCNRILTRMDSTKPQNVLELGDQTSESSLDTTNTYATHSYWRLSSNSSAGATVYYSGHTLSNTSGDEIKPIGTTADISRPGAEQFGLAMSTKALAGANTFDTGNYGVDYSVDATHENAADNGKVAVDDSTLTDNGAVNTPPWDYTNLNASYHTPRLDPLVPTAQYGGGSGTIGSGGTAKFAFDKMSDTIPVALASENAQVVDCVTAKMRYIGNIAATTPAGIYTTKINYIAAPQY